MPTEESKKYFKMNSLCFITLEAEEYPATVFSILDLPQCFKVQHFEFFISAFSPNFSVSAVSHFCWPWCNMYCTSLLCAVSIYSSSFSDMLSRSQAVPICAQGYQLIDLQMYNRHHCSRLTISQVPQIKLEYIFFSDCMILFIKKSHFNWLSQF